MNEGNAGPDAGWRESDALTGAGPELSAGDQAELDELERAAAEAYEQLGRAAERLSDRATEAYRTGRTFVRENPGGTLLSSFVIGVILGILISRR